MSTTISMWLGIAFVLLGIVAVILQAWLWSYPMVADPGGPDPHGKSSAPRLWTNIHRFVGLAYALIYVVLMIEMVPRLWAYQVELPARTVVHAAMGITIGVLLFTKVAIIRWFQHFGQALPAIGLALLICTLILGTLSIPYALQAHDFGDVLTAKNLNRVERVLKSVDWEEDNVSASDLVTTESMAYGRQVLTGKCVACHDMRTILKRPRNANSWYKVVKRMEVKPAISRHRVTAADIPPVTAYLVAITPELQDSQSLKKKAEERRAKKAAAVREVMGPKALKTFLESFEPVGGPADKGQAAVAKDDGAPAEAKKPTEGADAKPSAQGTKPVQSTPGTASAKSKEQAAPIDMAKAKIAYEERCSECHELDDVDAVAPQDAAGWTKIIQDMVDDNDAEFSPEEVKLIVGYLAKTKGK